MSTKKKAQPKDNTSDAAKVSPQEKTKAEKEKVLPQLEPDILQQILDNQKKQDAENAALRKELAELKENNKSQVFIDDHSQLDKQTIDDYMEVPVVFFAYVSIYSIHSYKLKGKNLIPPNEPIRFKTVSRRTSGSGMDAKVHAICSYICHSRRELDYLRNSPDFKVKFFENTKGEQNYDHTYAEILSKESAKVHRMSDHDVITAVKHEPRLIVKQNIQQMRSELISLRADDEMKNRSSASNKIVEEAKKAIEESAARAR